MVNNRISPAGRSWHVRSGASAAPQILKQRVRLCGERRTCHEWQTCHPSGQHQFPLPAAAFPSCRSASSLLSVGRIPCSWNPCFPGKLRKGNRNSAQKWPLHGQEPRNFPVISLL